VLLVTALLIIPANIARPWAATPERMALLAAVAGVVAVIGGMALSLWLDTPTGASVVACSALVFPLSLALRRWLPA
jgi:zinc transport system permease protein